MIRRIGSLIFVAAILFAGCSRPEPKVFTPASPQAVGETAVMALSVGDSIGIDKLFMSQEEFDATFSGANNTTDIYNKLKQDYLASAESLAPQMRGARFVGIDWSQSGGQTVLEEGRSFGPLLFRHPTTGINNVGVIVDVGGQQREIKLDVMFMTANGWRLMSRMEMVSKVPGTEAMPKLQKKLK